MIPRKNGAASSASLASSSRVSQASAFWHMQDFGAQPGDLNSLGYKDGIDQPAIEGSGVEPAARAGTADQGRRVHPGISG